MLTNSSVAMGVNLAEIITASGLKLVPKNNTLLNELNLAISNNMLLSQSGIESKDYIAPTILNASIGNENIVKGVKNYTGSTHDSFMDNYIEDISKLVTGYIAFTRSVVNKEINLLKDEVQASVTGYRYKEPEDFFSVKYFKVDEVFASDLVNTEIYSYVDSSKKYLPEPLNLKAVMEEGFELDKYLLTGDENEDKLILNWVNSVGLNVIRGYICGNITEYSLSNISAMDYSFANYLFYRALFEKTDIEVGFSTSILKAKCSGNKDYFGNMLCITLETYKKDIRLGRILGSSDVSFSYFNDKPLDIVVYEENFKLLAEAGLNIEVLFGYISSGLGTPDITIEGLVEKASDYLTKWNNTRSLYLINLNSSRLTVFKQILRERFEASLNRQDIDKDEQDYLLSNNGFNEETAKLGNAYIDSLEVSEIDNLEDITLELVAKIRYRYTNSYFLLKEMQEILNMDDKVDPMEAALYGAIFYIVDFVIEQLDTVKS